MTTPSSLIEVNACAPARFIEILGGVFEHAPWVARSVVDLRPFASVDALHQAMVERMLAADRDQRLAFLRGHPELAGSAFRAGAVTAESAVEQAGANLNSLTPEEAAEFDALNRVYRERYEIPFMLCMRRNTKESALAAFRSRLNSTPEAEEATALSEIAAITRYRLQALLGD